MLRLHKISLKVNDYGVGKTLCLIVVHHAVVSNHANTVSLRIVQKHDNFSFSRIKNVLTHVHELQFFGEFYERRKYELLINNLVAKTILFSPKSSATSTIDIIHEHCSSSAYLFRPTIR